MAKFLPSNPIKINVLLQVEDGQKYGRAYEASTVEIHNADGYNPILTARLVPHASEHAELFYSNITEQKEETVTNTYVTNVVHDAGLKAIRTQLDIMQQELLKQSAARLKMDHQHAEDRRVRLDKLGLVLLEAQQNGLNRQLLRDHFPEDHVFLGAHWDTVQRATQLTVEEGEV
jgi:hypothetical protein